MSLLMEIKVMRGLMPKAKLNQLIWESISEIIGAIWNIYSIIAITIAFVVILYFADIQTGWGFLLALSGFFLFFSVSGKGDSFITFVLGAPALIYVFYLFLSYFAGPWTFILIIGLAAAIASAYFEANWLLLLGMLFLIPFVLIILYCIGVAFYFCTAMLLYIFIDPPLNSNIAMALTGVFLISIIAWVIAQA